MFNRLVFILEHWVTFHNSLCHQNELMLGRVAQSFPLFAGRSIAIMLVIVFRTNLWVDQKQNKINGINVLYLLLLPPNGTIIRVPTILSSLK